MGDEPVELNELLKVGKEYGLSKVLFGISLIGEAEKFTVKFEGAAKAVEPDKAVVLVKRGEKSVKVRPKVEGNGLVAEVDLAERAFRAPEETLVVLGQESSVPTAELPSGGGGGGCSMGAPAPAPSGLLNLGVLLSGLLGLIGFRRKKN